MKWLVIAVMAGLAASARTALADPAANFEVDIQPSLALAFKVGTIVGCGFRPADWGADWQSELGRRDSNIAWNLWPDGVDQSVANSELTKVADGIADQYIRGVIGPATACAPYAANPNVIDPLDAPIGWGK